MPRSILVSDHFHFSHFYGKGPIVDDHDDDDSEREETTTIPLKLPPQDIKLKFYSKILQDENNIHFGKWGQVSREAPDAYAQAARNMTAYMHKLARTLLPPHRRNVLQYIDLGSGTGASAVQIVQHHPTRQAVCLNVCQQQNEMAQAKVQQAQLQDTIQIVQGDFEQAPFPDGTFDLAFSQDAFVHARRKLRTYTEAFRLTRPGGAFVFCDVTAGPDTTEEELTVFAKRNAIHDFLRPAHNRQAMETAGWRDVHCVDFTFDMRISFQLMLQKVHVGLERGNPNDRDLLYQYSQKIQTRIHQIDSGMIQWCVFHARKPVVLRMLCQPPVPFVHTSDLIERCVPEDDDDSKQRPSIVVVDILTKMSRNKIEALPSSVSLLITMSAGLDHIDVRACQERGITVRQAGRNAITSHVVQYALAFLILGLRNALSQLGVPFPSQGWNLNWNIPGKPLNEARIAMIGMGTIAQELARQIRCLAPQAHILYHVREASRNAAIEAEHELHYYADLKAMTRECDIMVPMCPLTDQTHNLINADILSQLPPHAGLLNLSRGGVVDTEALPQALEAKQFRYAILDTTAPEPLPEGHRLWSLPNCFILPHFATNTLAVRQALVDDIQPIIEEYFGLKRPSGP